MYLFRIVHILSKMWSKRRKKPQHRGLYAGNQPNRDGTYTARCIINYIWHIIGCGTTKWTFVLPPSYCWPLRRRSSVPRHLSLAARNSFQLCLAPLFVVEHTITPAPIVGFENVPTRQQHKIYLKQVRDNGDQFNTANSPPPTVKIISQIYTNVFIFEIIVYILYLILIFGYGLILRYLRDND